MFAEVMSGGNVLVTGVESLPSLGLVVTAGMMRVVVAEISAGAEWDDGSNTQVEVYAQMQMDLYFAFIR